MWVEPPVHDVQPPGCGFLALVAVLAGLFTFLVALAMYGQA